jgi:hypothetical protein
MYMWFLCYYSPHLARKNISFIYYTYSFNFYELRYAHDSAQYASDKTRPFTYLSVDVRYEEFCILSNQLCGF